MPEMVVRKCHDCGGTIEIYKNNIKNVVFYKNYYYHKTCLCDLASKKAQSRRGKPAEWQCVLDNITEFENDAIEKLEYPWVRDDFNEYLLNNYNIVSVPDKFWEIIGGLAKGCFKRKKCKPVSMKIVFEAWQWGQHKLNKINRNNKMNNKGPKDDAARLLYDLTILVSKVPNYLAHKAKMEALQEEAKKETKINHINYDSMQRTEIKHEGLDDISALLDEF